MPYDSDSLIGGCQRGESSRGVFQKNQFSRQGCFERRKGVPKPAFDAPQLEVEDGGCSFFLQKTKMKKLNLLNSVFFILNLLNSVFSGGEAGARKY